jgi:tetratricopeptide (TPR) repeat protein
LWETAPPLVAAHPEYRHWLAVTRYWRGTQACGEEEIGQGYQWFLLSDEVGEELAEEQPDNLVFLEKVELCRRDLTRLPDSTSFAELCRPSLETLKPLLEQKVREGSTPPRASSGNASNRVSHKRLALICLVLGDAYHHLRAANQARICWQQAADLYAALDTDGRLPATAEDALLLAFAAHAYSRLASGAPSDANYKRAVGSFERAGKRLGTLLEQNPDSEWLRGKLQEIYCSMARCHARAGRADLAEKTYEEHVRGLVEYYEARCTDPRYVMSASMSLCLLVHALREAQLRPAALAVARRAGKIVTEYAAFPLHYPELDFRMANFSWELSRGLRYLGDPASALQQAEHARKLWADYWKARPDGYTGGMQLAQAWIEVAIARQDLKQYDEAWDAFQEAVSIQRRVLDRTPGVQYLRVYLSLCYELLAECGIRRRDWSGAAAALCEKEKLWPGDAERLLKVSDEFKTLAEEMTRAGKELSSREQTQRQHFLAESVRIKEAARLGQGAN